MLRAALKFRTDAFVFERERFEKEVKCINDEKAANGVKRAAFETSVERGRLLQSSRNQLKMCSKKPKLSICFTSF